MEQNILYIPIVKIKQVRQSRAKYNASVISPKDILSMLSPIIKNSDREMFIVIGLSMRNVPNVINVVSIGTLSSTQVAPREVFKPLILSNCASFICVHNHVGGTLQPSGPDRMVTSNLYKLGDLMDIKLLDHLIICGKDEYWSFRENSMLGAG